MFYLNVNILLIILSNHCLIGFTHDVNKYQSEISSESGNLFNINKFIIYSKLIQYYLRNVLLSINNYTVTMNLHL